MKRKIVINIFIALFFIITINSIEGWSKISLSPSLTFSLIRNFSLAIIIVWVYIVFNRPIDKSRGWTVGFFLGWIVITGIRSVFIAEGFDQWTFFLTYFSAMISFVMIYYVDDFALFEKINNKWFKYAPLLCLLLFPYMQYDAVGYFLPLLLIPLLFVSIIPSKSKWMVLIFSLLIIILSYNSGARSHIIKFGVALFFGWSLYFKSNHFYGTILKWGRFVFLSAPILFFILGISNIFNIFNIKEYISEDYAYELAYERSTSSGASLVDDTRTFLYQEAILSAVKGKYVMFGRTFARGYDSYFQVGRSKKAGKRVTSKTDERVSEVAMVNIFTWMGLVGVVLYFFVFVKATGLTIYDSNNIYIKVVGLYVSFRWMFGFVEDFQRLDISTLTLWMLIAICFSSNFRSLTNNQISNYIYIVFGRFKYNRLIVRM
jgi:hypothetical protein